MYVLKTGEGPRYFDKIIKVYQSYYCLVVRCLHPFLIQNDMIIDSDT